MPFSCCVPFRIHCWLQSSNLKASCCVCRCLQRSDLKSWWRTWKWGRSDKSACCTKGSVGGQAWVERNVLRLSADLCSIPHSWLWSCLEAATFVHFLICLCCFGDFMSCFSPSLCEPKKGPPTSSDPPRPSELGIFVEGWKEDCRLPSTQRDKKKNPTNHRCLMGNGGFIYIFCISVVQVEKRC